MDQIFIEDCKVIKESDSGKALLINIPDSGKQWVPKSAITDDSDIWKPNQEPGTLAVYTWLAEKKGWV
jgi:hypothetical protein